MLWNLPGRPPRLTPPASAELACDAETIPILLRDGIPMRCRRCHRRIHRHHWKITLEPTGDATFHHRRRAHTSNPHTRRE